MDEIDIKSYQIQTAIAGTSAFSFNMLLYVSIRGSYGYLPVY